MVRKVLIWVAAFLVSIALALVLALVIGLPLWISVPFGLIPLLIAVNMMNPGGAPGNQRGAGPARRSIDRQGDAGR
jgi:hypothetical protein